MKRLQVFLIAFPLVILSALPVAASFQRLPESAAVHYEKGSAAVAREVARLLPEAAAVVERAHQRPFSVRPDVWICGSDESFRRRTGLPADVLAAVPERLYLNGPRIGKQLPRLRGIIIHELSHVHLQTRLGSAAMAKLPFWFIEGLAVEVSGGSGAEMFPEQSAVDELRAGHHFVPVEEGGSLARLVDDSGLDAALLYREAWMFVRFLKNNSGGWEALLARVQERGNFAQAFRSCYGLTVGEAWQAFLAALPEGD